jgi:hypothetical protein
VAPLHGDHKLTCHDSLVRKQERLEEGLEGSGSRLVQHQTYRTRLSSVPVQSK